MGGLASRRAISQARRAKPTADRRGQKGRQSVAVFPSELGWIAMEGTGHTVGRLAFGYASPAQAVAALGAGSLLVNASSDWYPALVARLQRFAARGGDDFRDVKIATAGYSEFQRRVIAACRKIPYRATKSYAEVAAAAGSPGAARAVGNVMASNQLPLIVPCHRVLAAGGRLGGYSNLLGVAMKQRLLALEAAHDFAVRSRRRKK